MVSIAPNITSKNNTSSSTATKTAASSTSSTVALTASGKPKEKRRNNEKRKEKSRDAARCRRSRETEIFTELAQILPLTKEDVNQLDKASVMRVAIAYLKIREMLELFPKIKELTGDFKIDTDNIDDDDTTQTSIASSSLSSPSAKAISSSPSSPLPSAMDNKDNFDLLKCAEASEFIKQTLDGFLITLSNDGDISYVSDNITEYLGIAKIDILGQQIWEYSHQCDHAELKEALNIKRNGLADKIKDENMLEEGLSTDHRDLFVRLKCTLTSRGRSINIKSASYKVIHITGHLVVNAKGDRVLIAIGRPIPHPSNIEIPLGTTTFLTKHSLDMKFKYVDDKMLNLFGYKSEDLIDQSLFGCHHGADSDELMTAFKTVLSKGQGETCRYRFLGKYGGFCWIVTQATIVYDKLKPQSVVCVNYVISNLENNDEIYSLAQFEASQKKLEDCNNNNNNSNEENQIIENKQKLIEQQQQQQQKEETQQHQEEEEDEILSITLAKPKIELSKASSPIPTPTPITQSHPTSPPTTELSKINANDDDAADINVDDNNITDPIDFIKREQSPSIQIQHTTATTPIPPIPTIIIPTNIVPNNNNNTNNKIIDNKPLVVRENSLSPLRRSLQSNCLIANKTIKLIEEKRPKSVTASVFRAASSVNQTAATSSITNTDLPITLINNNNNNTTSSSIFLNPPQLHAAPRAQSVTASVFTPISQLSNKQQQYIVKTTAQAAATATSTAAILSQQQQPPQQQDMNKGFLAFEDDAAELTMLKEEPDELVHLAPTAVDAAGMPLDETTSLFGEMLGFMGSYGSLLPDDINSLDSTTSSTAETNATATAAATRIQSCNNNNSNIANNNNGSNNKSNNIITENPINVTCKTTATAAVCVGGSGGAGGGSGGGHIDPFINYREESNDTNCSQHLLSPSVASKSPEASSLPSLCSPNSLSQEDEFAFMTMSVDDDIDMTMRAPYIPMNEQDDLPLLTADDLMWCGSNAFTAEDLNMHKADADVMQQLQQLQQHGDSSHRNHNLMNGYHEHQQQHQHQQHLNQQHFSNSLCSSPASTASSLSPSPQQQQQPQDTVYASDSSELAALLCGTGNGHLTILGNNNNDNDGGSSGGSIGGGQHNNNHPHQQQQQQQQQHHQQQQQSHCSPVGGGGGNGGDLQRLQQFQQQLLGLNIDCKKEKFDSANLCDSIEDAFENVYSKDSTNLDCWNDLLQINVNDTTSSSASCSPAAAVAAATLQQQECKQHLQLQQQQQQQQNIILNAVPLITIQSNKNVMLQQSQPQQPNNKMIINNELLSTINNNRNSSSSSSNKIATIKLVNNVTPATGATATIRVVENGKQLQQQHHQQQRAQSAAKTNVQQHHGQQHNSGNKRHLSSSSFTATQQSETKRLKSSTNAVELQATPQLLQQLMATSNIKEQQQKQQRKTLAAAAQRWSSSASSGGSGIDMKTTAGAAANIAHQQHQQQSNSVLKNLLISGCDDANAMPIKGRPIIDDNSMDQVPSQGYISASLVRPLNCQTSTISVLRNYRHNPMIGGPGVLPSPPFGPPSEDSNPPGLTSCDTGSESDSGIDEISMSDAASPLKYIPNIANSYAMKPQQQNIKNNAEDMLLIKCMKAAPIVAGEPITKTAVVAPLQETIGNGNVVAGGAGAIGSTLKRKISITGSDNNNFMDTSNNPLLTPFLMDLCNDDYNMNAEPFLEQNDIEDVLSEWTNEMV